MDHQDANSCFYADAGSMDANYITDDYKKTAKVRMNQCIERHQKHLFKQTPCIDLASRYPCFRQA